jgi:hypothetical protein
MKKTFLITLLNLLWICGFSQNTIYDKTKEIKSKSKSSISAQITVDKDENEAYTIKLKKGNDSNEFTVKPFQFDSFSQGFKRAFTNLTNDSIDEQQTNLRLLFMDILISRSTENKAPEAGTLHLENKILIGWFTKAVKSSKKDTLIEKRSFLKDDLKNENDPLMPSNKTDVINKILKEFRNNNNYKIAITDTSQIHFIPSKSQIEFTQGYIRNISITGKLIRDDNPTIPLYKELVFKNEIPIGFSSLKDFNSFHRDTLKAFNKYKAVKIEIPLSSFLCYHPNLRINTRDYCPTDGVIYIQHPTKEVKLHKEETSNILNAKIFTDVLGLQEDNPNGIIQTEIEKRITLWTKRKKFTKGSNYGLIQYAKPYAILSKIEKQNRYLELEDLKENAPLKVNSLELLKHEAFRVGTDINALTFDGPSAKSTICWDMGVAFSKVIASDTTTIETAESNKTHINNLNLYTKASIRLFPDERYGINFSYQLNYYNPLNNKVELMHFKENKGNKNLLQNMEMIAFLKMGDDGKLFFRYRLNSSLTNWDYNFAQVQLGYSFDITRQIK